MSCASNHRQLLELAQFLDRCGQRTELIERVLVGLEVIGLRPVAVFLVRPEDGVVVVSHVRPLPKPDAVELLARVGLSRPEQLRLPLGSSYVHGVFVHGRSLVSRDLEPDDPEVLVLSPADFGHLLDGTPWAEALRRIGRHRLLDAAGVDQVILTPFGVSGRVLGGFLVIGGAWGRLEHVHVSMLRVFARSIGQAWVGLETCEATQQSLKVVQAAEAARAESEARVRRLVDRSPIGMVVLDHEARVQQASARAEELVGASLTGASALDFIDAEHHSEVERALQSGSATVQVALQDERWFRLRVAPFDGDLLLVTLEDVTTQRRVERQAQRALKLESLGVLAGGIAHDFNNILTGIMANISLASLEAEEGTEPREMLDEALRAIHRAQELSRQLLTFAKGGAPVTRATTVARLLRDTGQFTLRGSRSRVRFALDEGLHRVEIDEGQISQVVGNLILNADQAMPDGGTIWVRARSATHGGALGVEIEVEDEGGGIPAGDLDRVFDPYFTTKETGTGLGLAISHSIVLQHHGTLEVRSVEGAGATFTLWLPATDAPATPTRAPRPVTHGHGRVLLMDDEHIILRSIGRMLRRVGYRVTTAEHGQAAIDAYAAALRSGELFDAVILDLTIPGAMGGREALTHLRALDPGVRVVVSSGYSEDPVMAHYTDHGFAGRLVKPYGVRELLDVLSGVITRDG